MSTLTISNIHLGLMQFNQDEQGNIAKFVVSKVFDILVDGALLSTEGQNIDVWGDLTEGQRQQLQNIKDRIDEIIGA